MSDILMKLLNELADGEIHSGAMLGKKLGLTRAAIWKNIEKCKQWGIAIESQASRGYCIPGGLDLINTSQIQNALSATAKTLIPPSIHLSLSSDSTNNHALQVARDQSIHGQVFLTEMQTKGRGRRGRVWVSPFASSIYCSFGWRFDFGVAGLQGLSLVIALAVNKMLHDLGIKDSQLKWPNDVLINDKKLAGILIETIGDYADQCEVVIGVGLNIKLTEQKMATVDRPWIDLHAVAIQQNIILPKRSIMIAMLLNKLCDYLQHFGQHGFKFFAKEWESYDVCRNRLVTIDLLNKKIQGIYRGVDPITGALCLETDNETILIHGGEVSLIL